MLYNIENLMVRNQNRYFYKYVTAEGAKKILALKCLKYSHPSTFNDKADCNFGFNLDFSSDVLSKKLIQRFIEKITSPLPILRSSGINMEVEINGQNIRPTEELQKAYMQGKISRQEIIDDFSTPFPGHEKSFINFIDDCVRITEEILKCCFIFCITEDKDNQNMWERYADSHTGIVLELKTIPSMDNAILAAFPVVYYEKPPPYFDLEDIIDVFIEGKDPMITATKGLIKYVTAKEKNEWGYEKEKRVVLFLREQELLKLPNPQETFISMLKEELESIYLGCNIRDEDKKEIFQLINVNFPEAKVYQQYTKDSLEYSFCEISS